MRDTIGTMPVAFLVSVGIVGGALLLQHFGAAWWTPVVDYSLSWSYLLKTRAISLAFDGVETVALALVALPVYRMAVQDETTAAGELLSQRTLRIAVWLLAYRVLTFVFTLPALFARPMLIEPGISTVTLGLYIAAYGLVAQLVLLYVWVRFGLFYPAVALGVPAGSGSRLGDAWRLSAPVQWRILWSAVIAFLPLYALAVALAVFAFMSRTDPAGNGISWGTIIATDIAAVASGALGAAVLGWNYRLITGRHHELTAETFA